MFAVMLGLGLGLGLKAKFSGLGLGLGMWGLGLGLACQRLVNNVLPLKLSSCMSHDAFDCPMKLTLTVVTVDCEDCDCANVCVCVPVLCSSYATDWTCLLFTYLLKLGFMPSFANLRPWFYPLKCEALALKTSGLGLVLPGLGLGLGLDTVGLVNITGVRCTTVVCPHNGTYDLCIFAIFSKTGRQGYSHNNSINLGTNSFKAKARQYKAKARGLQGQGQGQPIQGQGQGQRSSRPMPRPHTSKNKIKVVNLKTTA